jgi:hypothetical protein
MKTGGGREVLFSYAATLNKLATNLACPTESLLSNLLTGPFLNM